MPEGGEMTETGSRLRRAFVLSLLVLQTLVSAACRKEGDPVRATLDRIVTAAEKGDATGIVDELSATFQDAQGSSRAETELTVKRYLWAYERLSVKLEGVAIERKETAARATFKAVVSGVPRSVGGLDGILPRSTTVRFELTLLREEGGWKVTWGSWSVLSGDPG
jgi:hypothetical protein